MKYENHHILIRGSLFIMNITFFLTIIVISIAAKFLYQLDLFRIVRMVARAIEIVEPFCKINVLQIASFVGAPGGIPRLVRLIFSRYEAPIVASDLFQIEKREKRKYVVVKNSAEPFRVDDGSALLLQSFDDAHMGIVFAVIVIGNDVAVCEDDILDLLVRIGIALP